MAGLRVVWVVALLSALWGTCSAVFDASKLQARPVGADPDFDCQARALAYEYALLLQPWRAPLQSVYDALQLGALCNMTFPDAKKPAYKVPPVAVPEDAVAVYVDALKGLDSNSGTITSPFRSIQRALVATRQAGEGSYILLRQGTFFLNETINLGPQDSGLTITSYNGEQVQINGGIPLKTAWTLYSDQKKLNVYNNFNAVWGQASFGGDTPTIKFLGLKNSTEECYQACLAYQDANNDTCQSFTFHQPTLNNGWAHQCFARLDNVFLEYGEQNITSGKVVQQNVYVADLTGQGITKMTGLQLNNQRCIRARYPDADPETSAYPNGWINENDIWGAPRTFPNATTYTVSDPQRTDITMFQKYTIGSGGACVNFEPSESFWCSADRNGGGADIYHIPTWVQFQSDTFGGRNWSNPYGGIMQIWQGDHWENWMFEIDSYTPENNTIGWTYGGFQGARGCLCTWGNPTNYGGQWYVDGIFEELDSPNEFYFDPDTEQLYYFYNMTGAPPTSGFVATNLQVLFNATGSQQNPITNLTISNIWFQNTAYTYMEPHGVPSGGDWALQRTAALFFEGTVDLSIENNLFQRLDGVGLMLSGFNRYASIFNNEFVWIGDTAMASWGYTNEIDGTNGDQPRFSRVVANIVHEVGHFTKQSSAWFQGKSCQTYIQGNIFFNGPRAGINFNDGFGGANEITENLLFNQCRESSDHGPFNSWDREPFLTDVLNGTAQLTPAYNEIHRNFFICNYGSSMCVDNDDGSSYYKIHDNFEVYGGHKSDFGGHNKFTYNSVVAFAMDYTTGLCGSMDQGIAGFVDGYFNNTCIQSTPIPYLNLPCDPISCDNATLPISFGNRVYNSYANASVSVGGKVISETTWQQYFKEDLGTKAYPLPSNEEIIQWGRDVLGM